MTNCKELLDSWITNWVAISLISLILVFAGCSKKQPLTTGVTLSRIDMVEQTQSILSAKSIEFSSMYYAQVNYDALAGFESQFQSELSSKGVPVSIVNGQTGWETTFNCTGFTDYFIGLACVEYFTQTFQQQDHGARPAIFAIWYIPANAPVGEGHSITLILTNKGPVFFDPQVGEVHLTPAEIASIYHQQA